MTLSFRGPVRAVVTGGGSGLGRAFCLELARRGARVLIADIDLGLLRQVRAGADVNPLRDAAMGARVRCRVITGASDGGPRRSTNMPGARASRGGLDCPQGLFSGGRRRSGSGWV